MDSQCQTHKLAHTMGRVHKKFFKAFIHFTQGLNMLILNTFIQIWKLKVRAFSSVYGSTYWLQGTGDKYYRSPCKQYINVFKLCLLKSNCAEYLWYPRYYTCSSQPSVVISAVSVCLAHSSGFSSPFSCCLCTRWYSQVYSIYLMGWPLSFSVHFVVYQLTALLWYDTRPQANFLDFPLVHKPYSHHSNLSTHHHI